ncbi:hypothetical protein BELL_0147g00060 [Botrytis elliptica]|uniref:Uncharacterized protein n=1 Tax=Botrytis elliptica TaxID=278938 RepID=A0A4Z1JS30_9HELO|nr:hypothetical protein EAE99_010711 [Botrytis elliptica]TGO76589.1 hypothetical protein BELL_0147g00060 [Botrytis elliptica]
MPGSHWNAQADELLIWVAGGVWRHEYPMEIHQIVFFARVADFLNALNEFEPFDKDRGSFTANSIQKHVQYTKIQWKEPQCIERPPWLSEDALKGQFGDVGLEALRESTSRLRLAVERRHQNFSNQEEEKAEAQRKDFWKKEEEIREQNFRKGVEDLGYTKDAESPGGLSWTDPNASGFHYQEPESHSHVGALRSEVKYGTLISPHRLTKTSTAPRNKR